MKFLRRILDKQKHALEHKIEAVKKKEKEARKKPTGGAINRLMLTGLDAFDTFLFTPNETTMHRGGVHVKDAIDLKRLMMTVIIALVPCLIFGMWNVGHQHAVGTGQELDLIAKFVIGLKVTLPILIVSYGVGLTIEFIFSAWRGHAVNEGFLVSGMLIPLVLPPTIPLWQVAIATAFAVVIGKEVFGGTGMNVLNVALTARAFLYFAYSKDIAGSKVWTFLCAYDPVDGFSGATALSVASSKSAELTKAGEDFSASSVPDALAKAGEAIGVPDFYSFKNLFLGMVPGSIGETSTLMCLIGAAMLIITGVASWKVIVSGFGGAYLTALLFNAVAPNAYAAMPAELHLVTGGLAFGIIFMATDPVSAAHTEIGKWIYGFMIGFLTVLIRVFNPVYPEGIMLAILLMNVLAPIIDYYVVDANKRRRQKKLEKIVTI